MNLDKRNQMYLLTGVFFILLLIISGISAEFRTLLSIIVIIIATMGFHSLLCYKFEIDTDLNVYIKRTYRKLINRNNNE